MIFYGRRHAYDAKHDRKRSRTGEEADPPVRLLGRRKLPMAPHEMPTAAFDHPCELQAFSGSDFACKQGPFGNQLRKI